MSASFPISLRKEDLRQCAFTWMDSSITEAFAPGWVNSPILHHNAAPGGRIIRSFCRTSQWSTIAHRPPSASLFLGLKNVGSIDMDPASPHLRLGNPFHSAGGVKTGVWSRDVLVLSHVAPPRSCQPERVMQRPIGGSAERLAWQPPESSVHPKSQPLYGRVEGREEGREERKERDWTEV